MSEDYLEQKQSEIDTYIQNNNSKKIFDVFIDVKNNVVDQINFYEFVGNTFVNNDVFFMTKLFKSYNKNIKNLLNPEDLFKMEQYILQKYSFYPNETFVISFNGQYLLGSTKEVGRLHLTNQRIIFQGVLKSKGTPMVTRGVVQGQVNKYIHKKIMDKIQPTDLPCFGYPHSILGFNKVILKGKQVILKVPYGKIQIIASGEKASEVAKVVHDTIIDANNPDS